MYFDSEPLAVSESEGTGRPFSSGYDHAHDAVTGAGADGAGAEGAELWARPDLQEEDDSLRVSGAAWGWVVEACSEAALGPSLFENQVQLAASSASM
eukprot:2277392-Rhodomonas_salina.1